MTRGRRPIPVSDGNKLDVSSSANPQRGVVWSRTNSVIGVLEWRDAQDGKWIHASTLLTTSLQPNDHARQPWRDVPLSSCSMRTCCQLDPQERRGVSLLLGTPGVGCVTCLLALFSLLRAQSQGKILHAFGRSEASPPRFHSSPCPSFTPSARPLLSFSEY
jgi:hypothetical protein